MRRRHTSDERVLFPARPQPPPLTFFRPHSACGEEKFPSLPF
jgi:hypothetical protein